MLQICRLKCLYAGSVPPSVDELHDNRSERITNAVKSEWLTPSLRSRNGLFRPGRRQCPPALSDIVRGLVVHVGFADANEMAGQRVKAARSSRRRSGGPAPNRIRATGRRALASRP